MFFNLSVIRLSNSLVSILVLGASLVTEGIDLSSFLIGTFVDGADVDIFLCSLLLDGAGVDDGFLYSGLGILAGFLVYEGDGILAGFLDGDVERGRARILVGVVILADLVVPRGRRDTDAIDAVDD